MLAIEILVRRPRIVSFDAGFCAFKIPYTRQALLFPPPPPPSPPRRVFVDRLGAAQDVCQRYFRRALVRVCRSSPGTARVYAANASGSFGIGQLASHCNCSECGVPARTYILCIHTSKLSSLRSFSSPKTRQNHLWSGTGYPSSAQQLRMVRILFGSTGNVQRR